MLVRHRNIIAYMWKQFFDTLQGIFVLSLADFCHNLSILDGCTINFIIILVPSYPTHQYPL